MAHTQSFIEFRLDTKTWPVHGRIACRFHHTPPDLAEAWSYAASVPPDPSLLLDDVAWRLLEQTAETMGVVAVRQRGAAHGAGRRLRQFHRGFARS